MRAIDKILHKKNQPRVCLKRDNPQAKRLF